jgi:hypothetical protein
MFSWSARRAEKVKRAYVVLKEDGPEFWYARVVGIVIWQEVRRRD